MMRMVAADPFIGRRSELAVVSGRWAEACAGRPGLVLVLGEAGVGKTRFAREVTGRIEADGGRVVWARAHEDAGTPPFWLWRDFLRVTGRKEGEDRFELFDALAASLRAGAVDRGLVAVLDDLQWADAPSVAALRHVLSALGDARVLLIATVRTGVPAGAAMVAEISRESGVTRLDLHGFSEPEVAECLEAVGGEPPDEAVVRRVARVTSGNPFYVREVAAGGGTTVPTTVMEAVSRRVEHLPSDVQRLLRVAAVVGEEFRVPVVAALLDRPASACLDQIDAARAAGFLTAGDVLGNARFVHALVRMAVEAGIPAGERAILHRASALAIEEIYRDDLSTHVSELAAHWAAAAVAGDRRPAYLWAMRAADAALADTAFEEAVRLYRLALEGGGHEVSPAERSAALLGVAKASALLVDLPVAARAADDAMTAAREADDGGHQQAAVAIALECVGDRSWDRAIRDRCAEALTALEPEADGMRGRLLARLTQANIYDGDHRSALGTSATAMRMATRSGDVEAIVASLHARQLSLSGPEHSEERLDIAHRMIDAGACHRRPADEMWGHQWAIDASWEQGDLATVASELGAMRTCAERVGGVMARWHTLINEAALAQATASFDEAISISREAFHLLVARRHPAAFGPHMSTVGAVRHHAGFDAVAMPFDTTRPPAHLAPNPGEVRAPIFRYLGPAFELADAGRPDEARVIIAQAGSPERWDPPPYFALPVWAMSARVFGLLGDLDNLRFCCARLEPHRYRHVVTGAGTASYLGPVALELGRAARLVGDLDASERCLRAAVGACRANGAIGFMVEAQIELARTHLAAGDHGRTAALAADGQRVAIELGMTPWGALAAEVLASAAPLRSAGGALSGREWEVALLVARGRTNQQIADQLYVSLRTAQNHVQHILVKLGFSNRSQIATWVTARGGVTPESHR